MKISIVITAYNIEDFIAKAIESCLKQTYKNIEIIIINDASTDNTKEILNRYLKNKKIHIINNETNYGAGLSRRFGINIAKGEYILLLDGDDYLNKDFIKSLVECAKNTNADVVSGGITIIHDEDQYEKRYYGDKIYTDKNKILRFWNNNTIFINNRIIRKKLYDIVEYSNRRYIEDTPTLIPILYYANKVAYINNAGYNYIMRNNSLTHTKSKFKDLLFKSLCCYDLYNFFKNNDISYLKIIPLKNMFINILKELLSLKINNKELIEYMNEWNLLMEYKSNFEKE